MADVARLAGVPTARRSRALRRPDIVSPNVRKMRGDIGVTIPLIIK